MPESQTYATGVPNSAGGGSVRSEALRQSRVLLGGVGNIGSWCAHLLARAGVGFLRILDVDTVESKNFANQAYASGQDVGRPKSFVIAEALRSTCPETVVEPIAADVQDVPAGKFSDVDIYALGFDSLLARQAAISERALPLGLPVVDGGVDADGEWLGRVHVFVPGSACLECRWDAEHYRQVERERPCGPRGAAGIAATGATAFLGAAVASMMTSEILRILAGEVPGQSIEIAFDLRHRRWLTSRLRPSGRCRCDHAVITARTCLDQPLAEARIADLLAAIDVRFGDRPAHCEFRRGVLPRAIYGTTRFASRESLAAIGEMKLVNLGLTEHDWIEVKSATDREYFLLGSAALTGRD